MTVVRGGRGPSREEMEALARAEEQRVRMAQEQLDNDLRALLPDPRFQRIVQHLMVKCGTFTLVETLNAAQDFRAQARRGVGLEFCHEMGRADRRAATELFGTMLFTVLEPEKSE